MQFGQKWLCPDCESEAARVVAEYATALNNYHAAKRDACYTSPSAAFNDAANIWCKDATIIVKRHGATVTGAFWTAGMAYAQSGGWFDVR